MNATPARKGFRVIRTLSEVKKTIKYRYPENREFATPMAKRFVETEECPICRVAFNTPRKTHCRKDAFDHDHDMEGTQFTTGRGRLCLKCNSTEGQAKKKARMTTHLDKSQQLELHASLWASKVGTTPTRCKDYLISPPFSLSKLNLDDE